MFRSTLPSVQTAVIGTTSLQMIEDSVASDSESSVITLIRRWSEPGE